MEPVEEAWLERLLEDESWRRGLTDDQAERLLRWGMARRGSAPSEAGEAVRQAMRRIARAVQAPREEAVALLAAWGIQVPLEWAAWTVDQRLDWAFQALAEWSPEAPI